MGNGKEENEKEGREEKVGESGGTVKMWAWGIIHCDAYAFYM